MRSGEVDLAYQVFGAGEDMVAIPGLPSHLEVMWELPELAAFGPLWRQGALADVLAPSYAGDERFRSWWRRFEVYSATRRRTAC